MKSKQKGTWTIFWWVMWITLTIAAFFVAAAIWTPVIANAFGSIRETKASVMWVTAVFGTWIAFLVPLIIVMYSKVDRVYEDARIAREKAALRFRSISIAKDQRMLPQTLSASLKGVEEMIPGGHVVSVELNDGRRFEHVFVQNKNEIIGIYNQKEMPFQAADIEKIQPQDFSEDPNYLNTHWLRVDGVALPE